MFQLQSETRGEQTALIDEMIGNQKVVQAFGQEDETLEQFDEINGTAAEVFSPRDLLFLHYESVDTFCQQPGIYRGRDYGRDLRDQRTDCSVGQLSCFLSYANQYTKPFNEISGVVTELQNAIACAGRIFELIEEEPQIPEAEHAVSLKDVDGTVELSHVVFFV